MSVVRVERPVLIVPLITTDASASVVRDFEVLYASCSSAIRPLYVHWNGNTSRWRCINQAILRLLSLPSMLPPELWLRIFETAAEWDGHYVDIDFLRDDKRNRVLLAFAHVCRRWLPLVLHVLYREIFIPGWDAFDEDRRLFSDTRTPLKSLSRTLSALTARGSNLPTIVQVLHVPVGYQKPQRRYDYCQNGDFGAVAEVVELCPSLRHLSLRVHCEPTGGAWSIPASALRSLATATHLEQITYSDQQDPTQMKALRYAFWADMRKRAVGMVPFMAVTPSPSLAALFQIIHVLPSVRYLELKTSAADGVHNVAPVTLPNLREFRLRVMGRSCPSAATLSLLLDGATGTQTVMLSNAEPDQVSALPRSIATLFLCGPEFCLDLREFTTLSHIGLEFPPYQQITRSPALMTLGRLPTSVRTLTLFGEHYEYLPTLNSTHLQDTRLQELLRSSIFLGLVRQLSHVQQLDVVVDAKVQISPSYTAELVELCSTMRIAFKITHTSSRPWEKVKRPGVVN